MLFRSEVTAFSKIVKGIPLILIYGCFIATSILIIVRFLQCYIGSKSIYTILRMPEGRIRARFYWYLIRISILANCVVWMISLLTVYISYWSYLGFIPVEDRISGGLAEFFRMEYIRFWFPMEHMIEMIRSIGILVLIPALVVMVLFTIYSTEKRVIGITFCMIDLFIVYISILSMERINLWFGYGAVLLAIGGTIGVGLYYWNRCDITN